MMCRFCECTDTRACPGGCGWHKPEYCTRCAEAHLNYLLVFARECRDTLAAGDHPVIFRDRVWRIATARSGVVVFDHIGVPVFGFSDEGLSFLAPHYDAGELEPLFVEARP